MEILVEKREEFLAAGYVVFEKFVPVSHTKFVQFVQNQNVSIVKTRLVFQTIDRNAEILRWEVSMLFLVKVNILIIHEFSTAG